MTNLSVSERFKEMSDEIVTAEQILADAVEHHKKTTTDLGDVSSLRRTYQGLLDKCDRVDAARLELLEYSREVGDV